MRILRWLVKVGEGWEARREGYRGLILLFDDFQIVVLFLLNLTWAILVAQALWIKTFMGVLAGVITLAFLGRVALAKLRPLPLRRRWDSVVWSHYSAILSEGIARSARRGKVYLSYLPFIGADFERLIFWGGFGRYRRYSGAGGHAPDFIICDVEYLGRLEDLSFDGERYRLVDFARILRRPTYLQQFKELRRTNLGGAVQRRDRAGTLIAAPLRWGVNGVAVRGKLPRGAFKAGGFYLDWLGSEEARKLKRDGDLRVMVPSSAVAVVQLVGSTLNPGDPARIPRDQRRALEDKITILGDIVGQKDCIADPLELADLINSPAGPDLQVVVGGGNWLFKEWSHADEALEVFPICDDREIVRFLVWCEALAFIRKASDAPEESTDHVWQEDANLIIDWLLGRGKLHSKRESPGPIHSLPACSFSQLTERGETPVRCTGGLVHFPPGVGLVVRSLPPLGRGSYLSSEEWGEIFEANFGSRGGFA